MNEIRERERELRPWAIRALLGLNLRCENYVGSDHRAGFDLCQLNKRPRGGSFTTDQWCLPCEIRDRLEMSPHPDRCIHGSIRPHSTVNMEPRGDGHCSGPRAWWPDPTPGGHRAPTSPDSLAGGTSTPSGPDRAPTARDQAWYEAAAWSEALAGGDQMRRSAILRALVVDRLRY